MYAYADYRSVHVSLETCDIISDWSIFCGLFAILHTLIDSVDMEVGTLDGNAIGTLLAEGDHLCIPSVVWYEGDSYYIKITEDNCRDLYEKGHTRWPLVPVTDVPRDSWFEL